MHMKKTILLWAALLSAIGFSAFAQETQKPEYGYKVSDFVSKPKFGAYIIGGYKYSDQEGAHGGPGFNCRLIRMYVDGSIFDDFKYRIQFQANGTSPPPSSSRRCPVWATASAKPTWAAVTRVSRSRAT